MSLDIRSYTDSAEISFEPDDAELGSLWVEKIVAAMLTAVTVLCASSVAVLMYLA